MLAAVIGVEHDACGAACADVGGHRSVSLIHYNLHYRENVGYPLHGGPSWRRTLRISEA